MPMFFEGNAPDGSVPGNEATFGGITGSGTTLGRFPRKPLCP
jgi:hypothetical protein